MQQRLVSEDAALLWSTDDWSRRRALSLLDKSGVAAATVVPGPAGGGGGGGGDDGSSLVVAFRDDSVLVWALPGFGVQARLRLPEAEAGAGLCAVDASPGGGLVAAGGAK